METGANHPKYQTIKYYLILFFGLLSCVFLCNFSINAERLPVKTYTIADGLLRDQSSKIKQDSRGFLWFCTVDGISRFDGYEFKNFRVEDGLPERHANDFLETSSGVYLIATNKGLARLNPKGIAHSVENPLFTVYLPDDQESQVISTLLEDSNGTIWVGTGKGLFRLVEQNGGFKLENYSATDFYVASMIQDHRGVLWIGSNEERLFRLLPDGQLEEYTRANGISGGWIVALMEDADGRVWAGIKHHLSIGGLVKFVREPSPDRSIVERRFTSADGLTADWVTSIVQTSDGKMWIGTVGGLCQWQGENEKNVCRNYTEKNGICDLDVFSLLEDRDDNLWIGSRCGTKKMTRHGFTTYDTKDNFEIDTPISIFENSAGELFADFRSKNFSISRFDGEEFTTIKPALPYPIKSLGWGWKQWALQDSAGAWWLPTGDGLFRSPPATDFENLASASLEKIETGAKFKEIFRLFEDSHGDVWMTTVGSGGELFRWERTKNIWHDETQNAGFSPNTIGTVFGKDRNGNLWIATGSDASDSRLIRYRNGAFRTFTENEGSPPGWTRDLFIDDSNNLWLANTANGLLKLEDVNSEKLSFTRYGVTEGLSSNAVLSVTQDEFGRIYAGTGRGLDRLTPATGQIENFTTADGLPNSTIEVAYRDRQKRLWFATNKGLVIFQPELEKSRKPPIVLITGLQAGGQIQPVSILGEKEIDDLSLAANENSARVEFVGLGATLGENLKYEYRLGDENAEWILTDERTVNFANLAAGDYEFAVRAISADKIYSSPALLRFKIAAPIWQQTWFVGLAAIFIGIAGYLIYRNRVARLLEIERTRTRIATDLHDDIGTNLSKISLLSEIVNLQLADENLKNKQMLASIAEISRESVTSMSDIVWAINPNRDSLNELVSRMRQYAEETFIEKGVIVRFNAPEDGDHLKLSMDKRRDIYLIFKEAITNAARHSDCDKIEIDFHIERGRIFLQIKDDGRGFNISQKSDGNGLENMKRRAEANGEKLEIESETDSGTTIKIVFPQN